MEKYYNIHDIIKFKITNHTNIFHKKFSNIDIEYKNFESGKSDDLDFTIYIGNFTPSNDNCHILDDIYYIKEDYLYCKSDTYKVAKWKFEISGFENGKTSVRIYSNLFGELFICPLIINFLIHLKMSEKGYPLVHASCISKDNKGYLFSARGGGGKTTIALNLLEKGYKFLDDNFTSIHKNSAIGFLSPLNIFTYNLTPLIKSNLGFKDKSLFNLKKLIYKATFGYAKIFTQLNPKDIFAESIVDKTKLDSIFFLIPRKSFCIENMEKDELINRLVLNQQFDFNYFLKYITEYSYLFPKSKLARHWDRYRNYLEKNISNDIPIYKVEVPLKYNKKVFTKILEVIE